MIPKIEEKEYSYSVITINLPDISISQIVHWYREDNELLELTIKQVKRHFNLARLYPAKYDFKMTFLGFGAFLGNILTLHMIASVSGNSNI